MRRRRAQVLRQGLPYLVAKLERQVVGYAYASPYRARSAYRFSIENSVYVSGRHAREAASAARFLERSSRAARRGRGGK